MIAWFGAGILLVMMVLTVLLLLGAPLGELTLGGRYRIYSGKLRILLGVQLLVQLSFAVVILQMGGWIPFWFSVSVTRMICAGMAGYLFLNMIMNLVSASKKERYVMMPLSLAAAICFAFTAMQG